MKDILRTRHASAAVVALLALTGGVDALISSAPVAAIVTFGAAAAAVGSCFVPERERLPEGYTQLLGKVADQASSGRRLVIYERETGLLAYWYMVMRGDEECERARRYYEGFTLAIIEPAPSANAQLIVAAVTEWINHNIRAADSAGYAGNGRHVIIMPCTEPADAELVLGRLAEAVPGVQCATSTFGIDATSFGELYETAVGRLPGAEAELAAAA